MIAAIRHISNRMPLTILGFEKSPALNTDCIPVLQFMTIPIWQKTIAARHIVVA